MPTTTSQAPAPAPAPAAGRTSAVLAVPAAAPDVAHAHFTSRLAVETDCADVAEDVRAGAVPYTIIDVRGAASFAAGHVPGARNVPSASVDAQVAAALPEGLLVVYCWGPGCNGAHKAAAELSRHGRQVKEMIGGFGYWVREGQPVEGARAEALMALAEPDLVG